MEALFDDVSRWPGVTWHLHRFGGREWRIENEEIGHLHGNGVLDVLLPTRADADRAIAEGFALTHHTHPRTSWVSVPITTRADADAGRALLRQAGITVL